MGTILEDGENFQQIGDTDTCDCTIQQERALQTFLLRAKTAGHITSEVYNRIRPVSTTQPWMYGLPKLHKDGVPLRPILSMINAPQHELTKWLAELLKPVVNKYSNHTIKDTFEFCSRLASIQDKEESTEGFVCSFDIESPFTNILLEETIDVCLDCLYHDDEIGKPTVPENLLRKLLIKAITEAEFSYDGLMYRQKDGVAMRSPLGPVLANIFIGYYESLIDKDK